MFTSYLYMPSCSPFTLLRTFTLETPVKIDFCRHAISGGDNLFRRFLWILCFYHSIDFHNKSFWWRDRVLHQSVYSGYGSSELRKLCSSHHHDHYIWLGCCMRAFSMLKVSSNLASLEASPGPLMVLSQTYGHLIFCHKFCQKLWVTPIFWW